jgi:hypothetical protein
MTAEIEPTKLRLLRHPSYNVIIPDKRGLPQRLGVLPSNLPLLFHRQQSFPRGLIMEGHMAKKGLDGRHRDTTGRIDKHGNTCVESLQDTIRPFCRRLLKGRGTQKVAGRSSGGIVSRLSAQTAQMRISDKLQPMAVCLVASALCLNSGLAQAGPCTTDISQFEATIHQSAGDPFAGLTARQSVNAQLGHQPTPESVNQANERLKSRFSAAMARAKRYDAKGNRSGCTRALNAAKKIYIP